MAVSPFLPASLISAPVRLDPETIWRSGDAIVRGTYSRLEDSIFGSEVKLSDAPTARFRVASMTRRSRGEPRGSRPDLALTDLEESPSCRVWPLRSGQE